MKSKEFLMNLSYREFADRARALEDRIGGICAVCGRSPGEVKLMAVTKTHPVEAAGYAARYGLPCVGENRVQEGIDKIARADFTVPWELIGHLQSNKAAAAARHFQRIQSVDSIRLINRLALCCERDDRSLRILLQVNTGNDEAKFGIAPDEAPALLEAALARPRLRIEGLMTIAPLSGDKSVARRAFAGLRILRDRLRDDFGTDLAELSMGMSGDLEEAITEGSTCVRIGSALFGPRRE